MAAANDKIINEYLVWGYIRENSQKGEKIPGDIKSVCMQFLEYKTEQWSVLSDKFVAVKGSNDRFSRNIKGSDKLNDWEYAFGTIQVDPLCAHTVIWNLEIVSAKYSSMTYVYIGIVDVSKMNLYGRLDYGYCGYNGQKESMFGVAQKSMPKYGPALKKGDRFRMMLNMKKRTLRFAVNEEELPMAWNNVKQTSYSLAVKMTYKATELRLLDIERKYD